LPLEKLSKASIPRLMQTVGRHSDGAGLYLHVRKAKGEGYHASWEYQFSIAGRVRMVCVSSARTFNVDEARSRHRTMRQQVADGIDPIEARGGPWGRRRIVPAPVDPTYPWPLFSVAAEKYLETKTDHDFGPDQARDHRSRLKLALPVIGNLTVDKITTKHIVSILKPIWAGSTGNGKASKLRSLLDRVLQAAKSTNDEKLPQPTVAALSMLTSDLHKRSKKTKHHAAVPFNQVPTLYARLRGENASPRAARALKMIILTGVRMSEVLESDWAEFDYVNRTWTVPEDRKGRKTGVVHIVPLTDEMLAVLGEKGTGRAFNGGASKSSLHNLLEKLGVAETIHGFRTSVKDWGMEAGGYSEDLMERVLAHAKKGIAASYGTTTLLDKRREIMDRWSHYCIGK